MADPGEAARLGGSGSEAAVAAGVLDAIHARRSIKRFQPQQVDRAVLEQLLEAAVHAPNHRMTEPWRFLVLGPGSQRRYATLRAGLKAARVEDEAAAAAVREKVLNETLAVPVVVAVAMQRNEDPSIAEEDYAATFMAVQNLALAATALGLGVYIHTGRILENSELREILRVPADQRVVALLDIGVAAETPKAKPRTPAAVKTTWLP